MKKYSFFFILLNFLALTACSPPSQELHSDSSSEAASQQSFSSSLPMSQSTAITSEPESTHWVGTYEGVIHCPNCEGIQIQLTLTADHTYILNETYLGAEQSYSSSSQGQFSFDRTQPNLVILDRNAGNIKFLLGDKFVELRNMDTGKEIQSNANYRLNKKAS